jgi:hypothetical protein
MDFTLSPLLERAPPGPRIELGVLWGETLELIARHDGATYGVDSFDGVGEPSRFDVSPSGAVDYPRGRLKSDFTTVAARFAPLANVILFRGWVPEILDDLPRGPFAFAYVDLDHYAPTAAAIAWLWPRMMVGGILCSDDWFPSRDYEASRAVNEAIGDRRSLDGAIGRRAYWIF